jgi:hypothetical protein
MAARIPAAAAQEDSAASRYQIMTAYIYNFTQFTTWPADAIGGEFSVCVLGDNPFGSTLAALRSRSVDGKKIVTRLYRHMPAGIAGCNVLFVDDSERGNMDDIVKALKGSSALTMSDMDGFIAAGGMVEFERNDQKVGIKIGLHSVQAAGLSISSKLLRIADTTN